MRLMRQIAKHALQVSVAKAQQRHRFRALIRQGKSTSRKPIWRIWTVAGLAALELYLAPKNGSAIGVGDRSNRGYSGCSTARFTNARVLLRDIPVGSYVCLRTDQGRISQFRVNRISGGSPKSVTIGYTTYE